MENFFFQVCSAFVSQQCCSTVVEISLFVAYGFSNLAYVHDRSGADDSQDFCVLAKARRRGRSLRMQKEQERMRWATACFTDSDKWIRRSIIPAYHRQIYLVGRRRYDRMDVCSLSGYHVLFRILLLVFSYYLAWCRADPPSPLRALFIIAYRTKIIFSLRI